MLRTTFDRPANELQIQIDDVYACLGHCAGCALTPEERKTTAADMHEETLALTIDRLVEYASTFTNLDRVNITFGIADHILMGPEYLIRLHELGCKVIAAANPKDRDHSAVFFTTSLVGKPGNVKSIMLQVAQRLTGDIPFIPVVVLDARIMQAAKFGPEWKSLTLFAKGAFGKVDLATNLSTDAVSRMTPLQLAEFSIQNGFDETTVNWAPTIRNAPFTLNEPDLIANWLVEFDRLAETNRALTTSFRPVITRTINSVMCKEDGMRSAIATIQDLTPETIRKSIEIDHLGNLLPKFEAVGDITHAQRHGLKPIGNLKDGSIAELIDSSMPQIMRKIAGIHMKGTCVACHHAPICAGTGFHIATNVARLTESPSNNAGDCPHVAGKLIGHLYSTMLEEGH